MNDQNFSFFCLTGAQIDQGMAMTAGGQPINSSPVPEKEKNRYKFVFPLRPGETQFQVGFHVPYSGELSVDPGHFTMPSILLSWCPIPRNLPLRRARV
jgi:hypothetical protein